MRVQSTRSKELCERGAGVGLRANSKATKHDETNKNDESDAPCERESRVG